MNPPGIVISRSPIHGLIFFTLCSFSSMFYEGCLFTFSSILQSRLEEPLEKGNEAAYPSTFLTESPVFRCYTQSPLEVKGDLEYSLPIKRIV